MDITPSLLLNGVLALLIIKEVLQFVNNFIRRKSTSESTSKIIEEVKAGRNFCNLEHGTIGRLSEKFDIEISLMKDKLNEMHRWHDAKDEDGVFLWYVRKSLSRSMDELTKAILAQNDVLRQLLQDNKDLLREDNTLKQVVQDNQKLIQNNQELIKDNISIVRNAESLAFSAVKSTEEAAKHSKELGEKISEKIDQCFRKLNKE